MKPKESKNLQGSCSQGFSQISKISMIGSGRLAHVLCEASVENDLIVQQIYSRTFNHAYPLARYVGAQPITDLKFLDLKDIDLLFICVPDSEIVSVLQSLPELSEKTIVVQTSGAQNVEKLKRRAHLPEDYPLGTFHPAGSFTGQNGEWKKLLEVGCLIDGDTQVIETLKRFCEWVGVMPTLGKNVDKNLYHAACVMASNYLVTLASLSESFFEQSGLDAKSAKQFTLGLQSSVLKNLEKLPTQDALTGPIARGDLETVRKHLQALHDYPDWKEIYQALGLATVRQLKSLDDSKDTSLDHSSLTSTPNKREPHEHAK